jgi:hypothetical protein
MQENDLKEKNWSLLSSETNHKEHSLSKASVFY